ncbi:MAG TPA: cytochrome c [Verrucomicrobiae bacterium]|nr:cytochrome c [Verrucomicrobiae bacterium]
MTDQPQTAISAGPEAEPTVTTTTVPMWLIVGTLVLLFLSAWYFDLHGAWFHAKVYPPYTSWANVNEFQPGDGGPDPNKGRPLYESNCALCHNSDGSGKPGQAPPLAGSEWVVTTGVNRLIRIPQVGLTGPIKVKGQDYNNLPSMAGMGATYTDEQLADVLNYIRNSWGNKAPFVTPEQVKKVRTDLGGRSQPYTPDELMKLPE